MHKLPTSLLRNLTILLLAVIVVSAAHFYTPSSSQAAKEKAQNPYLDLANNGFEGIVKNYHEAVNTLFNSRIKILVKLGTSGKDEDLNTIIKLVTPPDFETDSAGNITKRKPCQASDGSKNLSTYCLSLDVTKEYFDFRAGMMRARQVARQEVGETAASIKINEILMKINLEMDNARQALDQGLSAYNELQLALPLHIKNIQLITTLEKYRDQLAEVRQQIDLYPTTFLDVTTSACI